MDVDDDLGGTLQVRVEEGEARRVPSPPSRPVATTSVSQKMLAVSASAIGRRRCIGVRWASWVLW